MNRPKAKGTSEETWLVGRCGARYPARRLSEGGLHDEGDVEADFHGVRVVIESKARAALSPQTAVAKAERKAGGSPVILSWKRLVKREGAQRATPVAGVPRLWFMRPETLFLLLDAAYRDGREEGIAEVVQE